MSAHTLSQRIDDLRAAPLVLPTGVADVTWRPPTADDIDAMHAVAAAADAVDHPTWLTPRDDIADTFDLPHIDHAHDTLLAVDAAGTVVAFGSALLHPARVGTLSVHLAGSVHPQWRRRGIGGALLAWERARGLEKLADAVRAGLPDVSDAAGPWQAELKVYAEESNRDHVVIAERAGFGVERWFTSMERDMAVVVPDVAAPEGVALIAYSPDRETDARLARNDAFRDHWGSQPSPPESWAKFVRGTFFRPDLSRLALDADGEVIGFCLVSVNEDDWVTMGASNAYIDLIGVVRGSRRRGVAPAVIAASLAAIGAAGLERAVLDVDTASPTGAHTLYSGLGFVPTERTVALVTHV
ncbi:GNAT family N-acetyltransferase [Microbacterium dextranolyticum]|uniref:GNAT family N-acetyltransferase n=1 Tax=Microbacterium dextranolyticum TaxID=36806 RepID=UPI00195E246B|nr:GNAT family N-acetyltransferase [Microbacterium dextranolyticum]MBM7462057.1 ribosomal protein S18 acetylase RimI-like enzyme [Microbacterium dextranolyticum]